MGYVRLCTVCHSLFREIFYSKGAPHWTFLRGRISIILSAEHPEKVDKLILVDSAGIKPRRTAKYYLRVGVAKIGKLMRRFGRYGNSLANTVSQRAGFQGLSRCW